MGQKRRWAIMEMKSQGLIESSKDRPYKELKVVARKMAGYRVTEIVWDVDLLRDNPVVELPARRVT